MKSVYANPQSYTQPSQGVQYQHQPSSSVERYPTTGYTRQASRNSHHVSDNTGGAQAVTASSHVYTATGTGQGQIVHKSRHPSTGAASSSSSSTVPLASQQQQQTNNNNYQKLATSVAASTAARPVAQSSVLTSSANHNIHAGATGGYQYNPQPPLQQKKSQLVQAANAMNTAASLERSSINNNENTNNTQLGKQLDSKHQQQQQSISSTIVTASLPKMNNPALQKQQQPKQSNQQAQPRKIVDCGGTMFCVGDGYDFTKQIGHGAYGVVCSGVDLKSGKKIAIKKVGKAFEDLVDAKRIVREIKMLKYFDHENIVGLHDVIVPETKTGYDDIYIVTELMETDLHRVIYSRQELSDEHIQYFLYQTLRAMLFIHSAKVMHRDLKPSNILVNKNCDLKVCDLGLARGFENDEDDQKTEYVVTRWYRAPEVILKATKYTKAVDVWSIGCIFAELIGRTPLFPGKDYLEQIQRIIAILGSPSQEEMRYISNEGVLKYLRGLPKRSKQSWITLFPQANPVGLDLLGKMLTFNPDDRFTMQECLNHPYFEGLHNEEDEPVCEEPFDWTWDDFELSKEKLQEMVYNEAIDYQEVRRAREKQQQQQQTGGSGGGGAESHQKPHWQAN